MALDIDDPPIRLPITEKGDKLSSGWINFFSTNIGTLQSFLSQWGISVPVLTIKQRDSLTNIQDGTIIYITDSTPDPSFQGRVKGQWKKFTLI